MKHWIVFALMLQSTFAFGSEECVIAENFNARKKVACSDEAGNTKNEFERRENHADGFATHRLKGSKI